MKNGRLLIVDDEPYTADSLSELFGALDSLSVEVFTAYSAREALGVLDAHAVDVVLTDVKMPKMSGIELQRVIAGRWPRCKVVFLSGFNDFEYIQSVIRHGGIDYVLKTESDEQIVSAVKNAFSRADEEERRRSLLEEARRQIEAARPLFKRELFLEVLTSPALDLSSVSERLASLELPLSGDRPVFLFLGRIDAPRQVVYDPESTSRLFRVEELSTAHLRSCFNAACVHVDQRKLAWLAQPTGLDDCSIGELLEAAQDDCREILDTTLSFAYEVEPLQWIDCSRGLRRLERLLGRGSGLGSGVIVRPDSREPSAGEEAVFAVSSRTAALDTLLEAREAEDLHAEIDAILHEVGSGGVPGYEPALQAFSLLSGVFISYLTRRNLYRPVSAEVDCTFLTNFDRFDSWDDIASYFHEMADAILRVQERDHDEASSQVITAVDEYITEHLGDDVSLTRLADLVHLDKSYLSRLYKRRTGTLLSTRIDEERMNRAIELLRDPSARVAEITRAVGFSTSSYFIKFFKKHTGLTPQDYRGRVLS